MSLEEQFKQVSDSVRKWKTTPPDGENLQLYSLYKQAIVGDVNIRKYIYVYTIDPVAFRRLKRFRDSGSIMLIANDRVRVVVTSQLCQLRAAAKLHPTRRRGTDVSFFSRTTIWYWVRGVELLPEELSEQKFYQLRSEPSGLVENAKWKAWSKRKGLSQDEAKKQYIDLAQQWSSKYA
ncbi:Putative acyl-CoA-binding protein [Eumeta japonica]|uniref:Acyl-CoA-binding protein n=1 Tax=Eumeta variegata TaxID=151549 RepID=A0A4C1ZCM1_EUMVA|nr:Putative acyl-CoA-binding protein [Eumeta japonica]